MKEVSKKDRVKNFLQKVDFAVFSTLDSNGAPSSAAVIFVIDDDLNIYIPMRIDTHKFKSCMRDARVSIAVFDENPPQTVQLNGTASEVKSPEKVVSILKQLTEKVAKMKFDYWLPIAQMEGASVSIVKVKPSWMRFASFGGPDGAEFFDIVGSTTNRS